MVSIQFLQENVLYALLLVPVLVIYLFGVMRQRRRRLQRLGDLPLVMRLASRLSVTRRLWKMTLWLLCVVFLIVSIARPVWGVRTDFVELQGISVYVLVDVSNSMNAEDIAPSRLERAKIGVLDLLDGVTGNEAGVIVFAGSPFVLFPLTTDVQSAKNFVNTISTEMVSRQGTAVGEAIRLAVTSFDEARATERVIVMFSDGENQSEDITAAIREAAEAGITIHVIGYGTEAGGSIPIRNSAGLVVGNKLDRAGNVVISTLNEPLLQEISDETGGLYQRVGQGNAIGQVIGRINGAEGDALDESNKTRGVERFPLFVALVLVLLSLEMLLPETRQEIRDHVEVA